MADAWAQYLARGIPEIPIYHMCEEALFISAIRNGLKYYPPTYSLDGFIHATEDPNLLLDIANHFYTKSTGNWICIELRKVSLGCLVIYEAAAPVGDISSPDLIASTKMPHIYGGIPGHAVVKIYDMVRDNDGNFLEIKKEGKLNTY